ncbi:MAG: DUF885 family protein [Egibacteraceae bacterium]
MIDPRLRAVCDLLVPAAREQAGLHQYDGHVADLSPEGVRAGLGRLGGPALDDRHDEAHLAAFEDSVRVLFDEVALHRSNPRLLLDNLDISVYARHYAPESERVAARGRHLAAWPDAIGAGLRALDAVPAPTAAALLGSVRGLAEVLDPELPGDAAAIPAHRRLVAHLEEAAGSGDPSPALGARALERLLGAPEATTVSLERLYRQGEAERTRVTDLLAEACGRACPGVPVPEAVRRLNSGYPDAEGLLDTARALTDEVLHFTADAALVEDEPDGIVHVAPSPASRRWATAMLSWAAPFEDDGPSWYLITPPDPSWSPERQEGWLATFTYTGLPSTTAHEVAPRHFTHGRALRRAPGDVRKALHSPAFVEGWAHYAEELLVEEGFRDGDPRYAVGVACKALLRVTRLLVSIGVHTGAMSMEEATAAFERDAYLPEPSAQAEANRATFDPTYGRYTWGKLAIRELRDDARRRWGAGYGLQRFHRALLALGAPPLGLMDTALDAPPVAVPGRSSSLPKP